MSAAQVNTNLLYEPEERCPIPIAIGVGFQFIIVALATMTVTTVIIVRAAGETEGYLLWCLFAALAAGGVTTIIQSLRVWRLGAGYVLIMGPSPVFVPVCITALADGGPAMMASLIVVSALFQFVLASRLSALRRVITPVVSGTILMMMALAVMTSVFDMMGDVPVTPAPAVTPVLVLVTLVAVVALTLRAPRNLQQWTPLIAIAIGWVVAAAFGLSDIRSVIDAPWVGIPNTAEWRGFHLIPNGEFLAFLPAFLAIALVSSIKAIGDGVAIQQASRRRPRATDFRTVQGAVNGEGIGNLLCGLVGTVANTVYPSSIGSVSLTGNAARRVGVWAGIILIGLALLPKALALLLAIPNPVAAGYMITIFSLIFIQGVRMIAQDGLDTRKAIVAGVAFWIGLGFQYQWIFPHLLDGAWGTLLGNGMTTGGFAAILMNAFMELTSPRRRRLNVEASMSALSEVDTFLQECASRASWTEASTQRLRSAGEESMSSLLTQGDGLTDNDRRRMIIGVRADDGAIEMEFIMTSEEENNLQDRLAYLDEQPEIQDEREMSFRLLRHYASSVQHRKYHNIDIVTVRVEA